MGLFDIALALEIALLIQILGILGRFLAPYQPECWRRLWRTHWWFYLPTSFAFEATLLVLHLVVLHQNCTHKILTVVSHRVEISVPSCSYPVYGFLHDVVVVSRSDRCVFEVRRVTLNLVVLKKAYIW